MTISDRMLVMDMGNIVQTDTPANLYNMPKNRFVYNFLGKSTFTNVIIKDGRVYAEGDIAHALFLNIPQSYVVP